MGDLLWKTDAANYNCISLEFFLNHTDTTALLPYSDIFCFGTEGTHTKKSSKRLIASFHYYYTATILLNENKNFYQLKWRMLWVSHFKMIFFRAVTELWAFLSYLSDHLPTLLLLSDYHQGTIVLRHPHFNLEKAD